MRVRTIWLVLSAVAFGALLGVLRGEPRWNGDQGVFLSIAARVLDGDRLYADVIDNKDPLFFYAHAAALWIGGWRGPAALDGLWLAIAALSMALLLRELQAPPAVLVAGFFLYPLALTASWYEPGLSMLGGLAVAPLTGWLWLRGRFALSGAVLAATALLKITVAPIAAAPVVAFLLVGSVPASRLRALGSAALGVLATLATAGSVLALRGELRGYIEVLAFNVRYPDDARRVQGGSGGLASHLDVVREFFVASGRWQLPLAVTALVFLVVATLIGWRRGGSSFRQLAVAAVAASAAALLTLAMTAIWVHHLQMLAFPAALIGAAAVALAASFGRSAAAVVAGVCVVFACWASVKQEFRVGGLASTWTHPRSSVGADLLESARKRFHAGDRQVTYMVFGSNSENAHAVFIDGAFDLECRWFHLYPNNAPEHLTETTRCGDEKQPELVLVTVGFYEPRGAGAPREWESFVATAKDFLGSRYELVEDSDGFQVWNRIGGGEAR